MIHTIPDVWTPPIHKRSVLVGADTVASVRGITIEKVYELVDGGLGDEKLLWVWDMSSGGRDRRNLRFWAREINEPRTTDRLTLENVVQLIIPRRTAIKGQFDGLRNWEIVSLFRLEKPQVISLREELKADLRDDGVYYPRPALEDFLRKRWCGTLRMAGGKGFQTRML